MSSSTTSTDLRDGQRTPRARPARPERARPARRAVGCALAATFVLALGLRLLGLGDRILSHPENFAPGLDVPGWLSFPPPRHDLVGVLKGTLIDGHPPTYFLALLAWTKVFGASLVSLRMPSALLGALSVLLTFRVARREARAPIALLAAALLALNGHHLYWSQMARMYVPAAFLALASTLFYLRLHERGGRRGDQLGFLATTTLALWTQLYAWPFLFAQMVAGLLRAARERAAPVALRSQLFAVVLGLPVVQLSIFQNPPSRWHQPAAEYFGFGYLFWERAPFFGHRPDLPFDALAIALGAILLVAAAFARPLVRRGPRGAPGAGRGPGEAAGAPRPLRRIEWASALALVVAQAGFATYALGYPGVSHGPLFAVAVLPLVGVALFPWIERRAEALTREGSSPWRQTLGELPLGLVLAVVPVLCMLAVSAVRGAYVARGTIVFLPFLAIASAQGVGVLWRARPVGLAALTLALALHGVSLDYFRQAQSSPRDYAGLAAQVLEELEPTDRVLVRDDFGYPPFVYYLRHAEDQLVYRDYAEAIAAADPGTRVWMIHMTEHEQPPSMVAALAGLRAERALEAYGIRALLYRRPQAAVVMQLGR